MKSKEKSKTREIFLLLIAELFSVGLLIWCNTIHFLSIFFCSDWHVASRLWEKIGDLVSKETVCCVSGKVKH